jgi:hypothetical protein
MNAITGRSSTAVQKITIVNHETYLCQEREARGGAGKFYS